MFAYMEERKQLSDILRVFEARDKMEPYCIRKHSSAYSLASCLL
jgi:hypothetical protein